MLIISKSRKASQAAQNALEGCVFETSVTDTVYQQQHSF